jgi:hypothetical protein
VSGVSALLSRDAPQPMDLDLPSIPITVSCTSSLPLYFTSRSLNATLGCVAMCRVLITLVVPGGVVQGPSLTRRSEVTPEGITETELGQTLLNGNNIAMVSRRCLPSRHRAPGKNTFRMRLFPPRSKGADETIAVDTRRQGAEAESVKDLQLVGVELCRIRRWHGGRDGA